MSLMLRARRTLLRTGVLAAPLLLSWAGCLKTLDESLLDGDPDAGTDASAGSAGSGGSSGNGGSGGTTDSGSDVDQDSSTPPKITSWDTTKYPTTNVATGTPPPLIAADPTRVFRTTYDATSAQLSSYPLGGGSGTLVASGISRPQAMTTGEDLVHIAAGTVTTDEGTILRVPTGGGSAQPITLPEAIERAVGIHYASDGFVYVSAKGIAAGKIALLRYQAAEVSAAVEPLYTSQGNESGGDVAVGGACVYWISNGAIWVTSAVVGGARADALNTPITNAIGLAADDDNLYYTRSDGQVGEIWKKPLPSSGCTGGGAAEQRVTWSPTFAHGLGDLVVYDGTLAWVVQGDPDSKPDPFAGGGVFTSSTAGGDITQIAPQQDGPVDIDHSPEYVVFATTGGVVRKVPKIPVGG